MAENTETFNINIEAGQSAKTVAEMKARLKELRGVLLSAQQGTEEYNNALREAQEIQHAFVVAQEEIKYNTQDFGQYVSNTAKTLGGLSGALQGVQAGVNLLGVESEATNEALLKMQSLMALTQSFGSIDTAIKAFKGLKASIFGVNGALKGLKGALVATGIGAAVVAIGTLIAYWDDLTDAIGLTNHALDEYNERMEEARKNSEEAAGKLKEFQDAQKAQKLNTEAAKEYTKQTNDLREAELKLAVVQARRQEVWADTTIQGAELRKEMQSINNEEKAIKASIEAIKQTQASILAQEENYIEKKKEEKKVVKEIEQIYNESNDFVKTRIDLHNALIDEFTTELDALENENLINQDLLANDRIALNLWNRKYNARKLDLELAKQASETELATTNRQIKLYQQVLSGTMTRAEMEKVINEEKIVSYDNEIARINELLATEELTTEKRIELSSQLAQTYANRIALITDEVEKAKSLTDLFTDMSDIFANIGDSGFSALSQSLLNISKDFDEVYAKMQKGEEHWTDWAQMASGAVMGVGTVLNAFASEQDGNTEESFRKKKDLEVAGATMNMIGGIIGAISSAMNPANSWMTIIGQSAMAAVMSAMVATAGALQISNIKKQKLGGGSGNISTSALSNVSAPVQSVTQVQGASQMSQVNDTRVYVAESDITATQRRVDVAQAEATY